MATGDSQDTMLVNAVLYELHYHMITLGKVGFSHKDSDMNLLHGTLKLAFIQNCSDLG